MSAKRQNSSSIVPAKKQKCLSARKKYFRINPEFIRDSLKGIILLFIRFYY